MTEDRVSSPRDSISGRRQRGGRLICLLGIDGSGKTTQATTLVATLRAQGVAAVHAWARWLPIFLLPLRVLGRALAGRRGNQEENYQGFTASKRQILRNPLRATLWKHLVLLEHALQVFFKVRLRLLAGKTVVADRYVYDTLIDLAVNLSCHPDQLLNEPLLRLFPRPDLSVLLELSPRTGAERKADGTTEEYLAERDALYRRLADALQMERVSAEPPPEEVQAAVLACLQRRLGV
jgi:dTMP kinase